MGKEKRAIPANCEFMVDTMTTRLELLYQRHAALLGRMDELERSTREKLDHFSTQIPPQVEELARQQIVLLQKVTEQEEESTRIFTNQNELLLSLQETLNDIHEKLNQLSERQDALKRRVVVQGVS